MAQSSPSQLSPYYAGTPAAVNPLERTLAPFTRWAFYAWMASLPFDVITPTWLPLEFQGNLSIPRMVGVLLVMCFLIDPRTRPWRLPPAFLAFVAFFGIFTLSMLRADLTKLLTVVAQFQLLLLLLICYNLFLTRRATKGALFSFAAACGVAAVMVLTGMAESTEDVTRRLSAFGTNENQYSELLGVAVLAAIGLGHIRQEKGLVRLPVLWAIILVAGTVIARSGSRGQTLAVAIGLMVFVLRRGSIWVKLRNVGLMAMLAVVSFYFFTHVAVLKERWEAAWETGSTSGRMRIYAESIEMIKERPIVGWGPAAGRELANRLYYRFGEERATHNNMLAMLTYTGLIGTIPYLWAYLTIVWYAWRARSGTENVLPLAIFVMLFVGDSISGGLPEKLHWTFFAYMLAAGALTISDRRSRTPVTQMAPSRLNGARRNGTRG